MTTRASWIWYCFKCVALSTTLAVPLIRVTTEQLFVIGGGWKVYDDGKVPDTLQALSEGIIRNATLYWLIAPGADTWLRRLCGKLVMILILRFICVPQVFRLLRKGQLERWRWTQMKHWESHRAWAPRGFMYLEETASTAYIIQRVALGLSFFWGNFKQNRSRFWGGTRGSAWFTDLDSFDLLLCIKLIQIGGLYHWGGTGS